MLASAARHPVTQLPCRGGDDACAVEMALSVAAIHGAELWLVHCGSPDEPTLRFYFGMGMPRIVALPIDADLGAYLVSHDPSLVVTGSRSGSGSGEGLLPYRIATDCGWPLIPMAVDARREATGWAITQFRPRGARRLLRTSGTTVVTVGEGGPQPRQPAFAKSRAGIVQLIAMPQAARPANSVLGVARPARHRPVASTTPVGTAADRRRAFLERRTNAARLVADIPIAEMAGELLQQLELLGVREPRHRSAKPTSGR